MFEAIITFSSTNSLTKTINYPNKIKYHWILQSGALCCIFIGFLIVYINKNRLNKQHFTSWHGLFGFISVLSCIPTLFNGIAALYNIKLKKYIKPNSLKAIHLFTGLTTFIFGGISLILSVYTKWFERKTNQNEFLFYAGLLITTFTVIWTLIRPIKQFVNKLK